MKTIYISGPITDLTTGQPREGWQKDFLDAEQHLRNMGFNVLNPVDIAREVEMTDPRPTRSTYILACLHRMKVSYTYDHLHGVYVICSDYHPLTEELIFRSDGVMMELHMAHVFGIPIFAQFYEDNEIDIHLLRVKDGKRLLDNGDFGRENWSEKAVLRLY